MQIEIVPSASEPIYPKSNNYDPPSRKLALAMLIQAIRDLTSPRKYKWKKDENWRADAMAWFNSKRDAPGSFPWVCYHLQIDPCQLRNWVVRYQCCDDAEKSRMAKKLVRIHFPSSA